MIVYVHLEHTVPPGHIIHGMGQLPFKVDIALEDLDDLSLEQQMESAMGKNQAHKITVRQYTRA